MRAERPTSRRARGFSLLELVLVIAIGAIIAAMLAVFLRPAFDSWFATRDRAELADQADTALRLMVRDTRSAVPNSIRSPNAQCFELVPTSTGGRARLGPDTANDAAPACAPAADCAAPLDPTAVTTAFDVLSELAATPAVGDWVVVGNQNPNDVYAGVNRAAITAVTTPAAAFGRLRLAIAPTQFPVGFDSGRFVVVPAARRTLFYVCSGADGTLDANGDGKGTLWRLANGPFNAAYPAACPSTAGADLVATQVRSCRFVYDPNQGATQQNGFVWMQLELARRHETVSLAIGAHVANVP